MALPASDSFTDSNGVQLTSHNASWTLCKGDFDIQSNSLAADASGELGAGWNADAFNADQYAEATVSASGVFPIGIAVRCDDDTPNDDYYGYYGEESNIYLFKVVNGSWTELDADSENQFSVSDVIRLEITGTNPGTLSAQIGGVEQLTADDSDLDAGSAGVSGWNDHTTSLIDDWEGGNLGGSPVTVNVSAASLTATGQSATLTPGAVSITVSTSGLTAGAESGTVTQDLTRQQLQPTADTVAGQWTTHTGATTNLYQQIDEAPYNDADYIKSDGDPSSSAVAFALGAGSDPGVDTDHVVRYRYSREGDAAGDLTVELREGYVNEGTQGTLIASWQHNSVGTGVTEARQALTTTQAGNIGDYSDLFLRFVATV